MSDWVKSGIVTELEVPGNLVSAKELAQILKLSKSKVYKLAFKGEIPGFKIGDSWRFDIDEIIQWVKGR